MRAAQWNQQRLKFLSEAYATRHIADPSAEAYAANDLRRPVDDQPRISWPSFDPFVTSPLTPYVILRPRSRDCDLRSRSGGARISDRGHIQHYDF